MKIFITIIAVILLGISHPVIAEAHITQDMPDALAEMEYRILLDFQPEKNDVRNKLGMALLRMKKIDEAEKEFNIVLNNDPQNFNGIDALGLVRLKRGEFEQALALFNRAIAINPHDILVYYHLALAYIPLKRLALAKENLEKSLKNSLLPSQQPINKQVGKVLIEVKKTLHQVNTELAKNPESSESGQK